MEHLGIALRAIFSQQKGDLILRKAGFIHPFRGNVVHLDTELDESDISKLLLREEQQVYSIDQLSMTGQVVLSKWVMPDPNCLPIQFYPKESVFNMLLHFATKTLLIKDGDPVCRYDTLLRWHLLTVQLGEDLFSTALLAANDSNKGYLRTHFDWNAFLGHDCKELNVMFQKPMAELHMHLKGSSYNVDISWICLMNYIQMLKPKFDEVSSKRKCTEWDFQLFEKMRKAAAIRLYLAGAAHCIHPAISKAELEEILNIHDKRSKEEEKKDKAEESILMLQNILNQCHRISVEKAKKYQIEENFILDYISVEHYSSEPVSNLVMASERKLMYNCFRRIYSAKDLDPDFATLFYAYLTYKDLFRHTILQLNARVGFANFANYEELKSEFILDKYNSLLYRVAIEGFIGNSNCRYIEARIVPKRTPEAIRDSLQKIYGSVEEKYKSKCGIIFHFIKKRDESFKPGQSIRHRALREEVKEQAFAIYKFRQKVDEDLVGAVVGIDAANSEIFARPEVFAQPFRFLRMHEVFPSECKRPDDLNITYHVGEDFLDVADGLRAVEEALIFLGLRNGDRLGHALALGTDVRKYYRKRYDTICESKQVILDNMAWLHHKCVRLIGYCPLCGYLEMMFHKYFREMFNVRTSKNSNLITEIFSEPDEGIRELDNVETYYLSWLLRGNSPTFGADLEPSVLENIADPIEKQWAKSALNHHKGVEMACRNANARELCDRYHSQELAAKSNDVDSFTIPSDYRDEYYMLLERIQEDLLRKIEKRHIAIECNPSSNYKIGEIDRYDQHPILRFFNFAMDTPYVPHNIAVSINTDDQGVFSTSLEREYSLMALALERNEIEGHKNSPRAILEWLNRVREMSIEQRFDRGL